MKFSIACLLIFTICYASSIVPIKQLQEKMTKQEVSVKSSDSTDIPCMFYFRIVYRKIVVNMILVVHLLLLCVIHNWYDLSIAVSSTVTFKGSKGKTPKTVEVNGRVFSADGCQESNWKYNERDVHSITPKEKGFVKLTCEKVYITLSESSLSELGCTSLKANKEYDVSKTKCIDSKGEDQFETFRDNIGDESDTYIEFSKDSVNYSMVNFNRISNSGCSVVGPVVIVCVVVVIVIIFIVVAIVMSKKNKMPKKK